MIDAIGAALAPQPNPIISPAADVEVASWQRASPSEEADFARAAKSGAVGEVEAARPARGDALSNRLAGQMDDIAAHLKSLSPGAEPTKAGAGTHGPGAHETGEAVSAMERAYTFAIETTMASRGSTESTKIFNTLLKGQ